VVGSPPSVTNGADFDTAHDTMVHCHTPATAVAREGDLSVHITTMIKDESGNYSFYIRNFYNLGDFGDLGHSGWPVVTKQFEIFF